MDKRITKDGFAIASPKREPWASQPEEDGRHTRQSGWRLKATFSSIFIAFIVAFGSIAFTPDKAFAMGTYLADIDGGSNSAFSVTGAERQDTCLACHVAGGGAGRRNDFGLAWKFFDMATMDSGGLKPEILVVDVHNIGRDIAWNVTNQDSSAPNPFVGAPDKDNDGYIRLYFRTEISGSPSPIIEVAPIAGSGGGSFLTPPLGWDIDDNDGSAGNITWGDPYSAVTTEVSANADTFKPDTVLDLRANTLTSGALDLVWTAPADDFQGSGGADTAKTVHHYDIRYSTETSVNAFTTECGGACSVREPAHWKDYMWEFADCGIFGGGGGGEYYLSKTGEQTSGSCSGLDNWNTGEVTAIRRAMYEVPPTAIPGNDEFHSISGFTTTTGEFSVDINPIIDNTETYWVALRSDDGRLHPLGGTGFTNDFPSTGFDDPGTSEVSNIVAITTGSSGSAIQSFSPNTTDNGDPDVAIAIIGLGLASIDSARLYDGGTIITCGTFSNQSATTLDMVCNTNGATGGTYDLDLFNGGTLKAAWVDAILVTSGGGGDTQALDSFANNAVDTTPPTTNHPMATIVSTAGGNGVALTTTRVSIGGGVLLADVASIRVTWNGSEAGLDSSLSSLIDVDIPLSGAGSGSGTLVYQVSLNAGAAGKTFNLTVTSVTGSTSDAANLPQTSSTVNALAADTQALDSFASNAVDTTPPTTNHPMATIVSTAGGNGVALTTTRVSIGGGVLLADVASIRVTWEGSEAGLDSSLSSLIDVDIPLSGAGSGSGTLVYQVSLNASAAGKTFNLTVTSVTGSTSDAASLPQISSTVNALAGDSQGLDSFADNAVDVSAPVTNHPMATIVSSAGGSGVALTSTTVSIGGGVSLADVASIRVTWEGSEAGLDNTLASLTDVAIPLSGAGSGTGTLVYQVSLNASAANKTFNMTVTSVAGATSNAANLPQVTSTVNALPGPTDHLVMQTEPVGVTTDDFITAEVRYEDANNNTKTDASVDVTVAAYTNSGCSIGVTGNFTGTMSVGPSSGVSNFTDLAYDKVETIYLCFESTDVPGGNAGSSTNKLVANSVAVSVGAASQLYIDPTHPGGALVDISFSPAPKVYIRDAAGNNRSDTGTTIDGAAFSVNDCTGGVAGALSGNSLASTGGFSEFTAMQYNNAPETIYIKYTSGVLTSACHTAGMSISAGPAEATTVDADLEPNTEVAGFSGLKSFTYTINPGGGTNDSIDTIKISNPLGGFDTLSVTTATIDTVTITNINGATDSTPGAGDTLNWFYDAGGDELRLYLFDSDLDGTEELVVSFDHTVTLSPTANTSYDYSCTFNNEDLDFGGSYGSCTDADFTLTTVPGALDHLTIVTSASTSATAGSPFGTQPVIQARDVNENVITTEIDQVDVEGFTDTLCTGGNEVTGIKTGTWNMNAVLGEADFTSNAMAYQAAETIYLKYSYPGPFTACDTSNGITVSPDVANKVVIIPTHPTSATISAAFNPSPTVQIQDQYDNPRNSDTSNITATAWTVDGCTSAAGGNLTGTVEAADGITGTATFDALTYDAVADIYIMYEGDSVPTTACSSSPVTVSSTPTVNVGDGVGASDSTVAELTADVAAGTFSVSTSDSVSAIITDITITEDGTGTMDDVTSISIWLDTGTTLGSFQGTEDEVGTIASPGSGNVATFNIADLYSGSGIVVPATGSVDYIITYDIDTGVTSANTLQARVSSIVETSGGHDPNVSDAVEATITVDSAGPTGGTIFIDTDASYTTDTDVALTTITCTDTIIGCAGGQMWISNDADFSTGSWEGYATSKGSWTLLAGDGLKDVYIKFEDALGNQSAYETSDAITLDGTSPDAPTLVGPTDGSYTSDITPEFSWNDVGTDTSGIANYNIEVDDEPTFTTPWTIQESAGTGTPYTSGTSLTNGETYYWRLNAVDNAGNGAGAWSSPTWSFTVDTTAPSVSSTDPFDTETDVGTSYNITVNFTDGPIDCNTLVNTGTEGTSSFFLKRTDTTWEPATVVGASCTGTQAELDPTSALDPLISYTVYLTSDVKDQAGNALTATPYSFSYTTVNYVDVDDPIFTAGTFSGVDDGATSGSSVTLTWPEGDDGAGTIPANLVYYLCAGDAPGACTGFFTDYGPYTGGAICGGGTCTQQITDLVEGDIYYIKVRVVDEVPLDFIHATEVTVIPYDRTLSVYMYNMVSVPGDLDGSSTPQNIFYVDDLVGDYLRMLYWNTGSTPARYGPVLSGTALTEGQGYWLLRYTLPDTTMIDIDGSDGDNGEYSAYTAQVAHPSSVLVPLVDGWNAVGNPCITNVTGSTVVATAGTFDVRLSSAGVVTFSAAVSGGQVKNTVYHWTGTNYGEYEQVSTASGALRPWKGYWLFVYPSQGDPAVELQIYCDSQ